MSDLEVERSEVKVEYWFDVSDIVAVDDSIIVHEKHNRLASRVEVIRRF
jgi:hypothetical protein